MILVASWWLEETEDGRPTLAACEWREMDIYSYIAADGSVLEDSCDGYPPPGAVWLQSMQIVYPVAGVIICKLREGYVLRSGVDIELADLIVRVEDVCRLPPTNLEF